MSTDGDAFVLYDFPSRPAKGICPSLKQMALIDTITNTLSKLWDREQTLLANYPSPSVSSTYKEDERSFEVTDIIERIIATESPVAIIAYAVERGRCALLVRTLERSTPF